MKRIISLLFSLGIAFVGYVFVDFFVIKRDINASHYKVEQGETYSKIYDKFNIRYGIADKIYLKLNPKLVLKEGYYLLNSKMSKFDFVNALNNPDKDDVVLTIPEGFTQKQIFERIEALGLATAEEMLNALNAVDFDFYHEKDNFDGYLYPETYFINKGAKPIDIANLILGEFKKNFKSENYPDKKKFYNDLKLASIVEFETAKTNEKSEVAGIFKHRLNIGMKLQSDATLKYELGRIAYRKELLSSDSLYNTYAHKGLPPTPICNPSKETIEKTIAAPVSKYLYFFMSNGKTFFSLTHDEHLRKRRAN